MTTALWKKPKFIMAFSLFLFFLFGALFSEIMDEIWQEKQLLPLDQATSHWMSVNQEPYDRLFFLTITDLSEGGVLAVLTLLITASLWFYRRRVESILFFGGFGVTGVSVAILKFMTDRVRPAGASLLHETSAAFPSGHAALSLFFFGFLAYLLSRRVQKKRYSVLVFAAGLSIAGLIGASRVYLNVHWLSDVLGGFALAAAFLSLCIGFLEMQNLHVYNSRHKVTALR
ncbi:MAG: phosphatase PAP2 family protein [Pseudomonadota bacterium]|nr:phosphatase PAP2 family protein [Pseudomonadota bacterium]MDE3036964.1 phosphatase PAP2 family protein [Pseudomonadota bacterium]